MKIRDTKPRMRRDGETDRSWEAHCKRREAAMAKRPGRSWRVLVQSSTDHWDAHSEDHPGLVFDELVVDHWIHLEQMSTRIWYLGIGDHQLSIYVPRDGSPPKLVHYELGDLAKIIKAKGVPR